MRRKPSLPQHNSGIDPAISDEASAPQRISSYNKAALAHHPAWLSRQGKCMKAPIIAFCLGFSAAVGAAASVDSWIVQPPSDVAAAKAGQKFAVEFFEVVASMRGNAEVELQEKPFVAVSETQARKLAGRCYSCPHGKRAYLVRAVYGFAGTGAFGVSQVGRALWVAHESLGEGFVSARSAVIVNLDFEPSAAYATVAIAR